jgi:hypothetical protein
MDTARIWQITVRSNIVSQRVVGVSTAMSLIRTLVSPMSVSAADELFECAYALHNKVRWRRSCGRTHW